MFGHPLHRHHPALGLFAVLVLTAVSLQAMDLKLTDGRVLKDAKVGQISGASISIMHSEGVSGVQPEDLSDESRNLLRKEIRTYWKRHHKFVIRKAQSLPLDKRVEYLSDEIDKHPDAIGIQEWRSYLNVVQAMVLAQRTPNIHLARMTLEKVLADDPDALIAAEVKTQLEALLAQPDELAIGEAVWRAGQESDPDTALAILQEAMAAHPKAANLTLAEQMRSKREGAALRNMVRRFSDAANGSSAEARQQYEEITAAVQKYSHADPAAQNEAQQLIARIKSRIGSLDSATDQLAQALTMARKQANLYGAVKILEKAIADHPDAPNLAEAKAQLAAWQAQTDALAIGRAVLEMEKEPDFETGIAVLKEVIAAYPHAPNLALAKQLQNRLESGFALRKAIRNAEQESDPDTALAALKNAVKTHHDAPNLAEAEPVLAKLEGDAALRREIRDAESETDLDASFAKLKKAIARYPNSSFLEEAKLMLAKLETGIKLREERRAEAERKRRAEEKERRRRAGIPMIPNMEKRFPFRLGVSFETVKEECRSFVFLEKNLYEGVGEDGVKRRFIFSKNQLKSVGCLLDSDAFVEVTTEMEKKYGMHDWEKTNDGKYLFKKWFFSQYDASILLFANNCSGEFGMLMTQE